MRRKIQLSLFHFIFFLIIILSTFSCTHETINFSELDTVCFESKILPIIQNSCGVTGCHDVTTASEGVVLTNYASVLALVTPGDARSSKLYQIITDINGENLMPPDDPLSQRERNLIQVWINQGALNTSCPDEITDTTSPPDSDKICFTKEVLPIFLSNCATSGCHDIITAEDGYVFTDYAAILSGEDGIVPFKPSESEVYLAITNNDSEDKMPPDGSLTSEQINAIYRWIAEGAENTDCQDAICDTLQTISFSGQVFPIFQTNCTACHNSPPGNGGILLNNHQNIVSATNQLRNNEPVLTGAIRHMAGFTPMPSAGYTLDECSIRTIELWIAQGTPNN